MAVALSLALAAVGCDQLSTAPGDGPVPEATAPALTCADRSARTLSGTIPDTLLGRATVYLLTGTVQARALRIEEGVLVCGAAGSSLMILDTLTVSGTRESPVRFTALVPGSPWGGISGRAVISTGASLAGGAHVSMLHVLVEHATQGLRAPYVALTSVRFRRLEGVALQASGYVRGLVADTVCTGAAEGCFAVMAWPGNRGGRLTLAMDSVVIRTSGGDAIRVGRNGFLSVSDLLIHGPARSALVFDPYQAPFGEGDLEVRGSISIIGQGGFLADGAAPAVARLVAAYADRVRPGASVRSVGSPDRPIVIPAGVVWRAEPNPLLNDHLLRFGRTTLGPGAELTFGGYGFGSFASLELSGSAVSPARLTATRLSVRDTGALSLTHARVQVTESFEATGSGAQVLSDTRVEGGTVTIGGARARLQRVVLDGAALVLRGTASSAEGLRVSRSPGHGIVVQADSIRIDHCVVTASARDGVHVTTGAAVGVEQCDLTENGGAGVANEGPDLVTARHNWWGDAAGPTGPRGDGVEGRVDAGSPRPGPQAGDATSASIRAAQDPVATAAWNGVLRGLP